MLYTAYIKVPANTPKENPVVKKIKINERYLTRITVFFPPGVACLARVAFFYGERQILPPPDNEWITGHAYPISSSIEFRGPEIPWDLTIKAYNLDTRYDHTLYIYLETSNILLSDVYNAMILLSNVMKEYAKLVGGVSI
ncbi:hypothetical protein J7K74_03750 [Candidatus Woesearchaeota archaeon]|nr:hypothetical protein [Candidatus Woesearchaeota archaeon]